MLEYCFPVRSYNFVFLKGTMQRGLSLKYRVTAVQYYADILFNLTSSLSNQYKIENLSQSVYCSLLINGLERKYDENMGNKSREREREKKTCLGLVRYKLKSKKRNRIKTRERAK